MIEVHELTKQFGKQRAVDGVSFRCEPGTVTGFLGPNGAGKSTTMRALVGLTQPTSGSATIDGRSYRSIPSPGHRVGVLLDASAQHAGRTGRETLLLSARVLGIDRARVEELLALVQLTGPAAKKRVGDYSLGMRQRLGIAQALLARPGILILDEPANGLDPEGIRWMRGLLRDFADAGGTVLLSSHLLGEIDAVADRLVIIHRGKIKLDGSKDELLGGGGVVVRSDDGRLGEVLAGSGLAHTPLVDGGEPGFVVAGADARAVGQVAAGAGIALTELQTKAADLEQVFLELTASHTEGTEESA